MAGEIRSDSDIQPVNIHRLVEIFELIEADYVLVDKILADADDSAAATNPTAPALVLQTGLPHAVVHFDIEGDVLSAFATWSPVFTMNDYEAVAQTVAALNWSMIAPTLSYQATEDAKGTETIRISANRAMAIGEGLSRNQLGRFVLSCFDSFGEAFDTLAEEFPHVVTWEED